MMLRVRAACGGRRGVASVADRKAALRRALAEFRVGEGPPLLEPRSSCAAVVAGDADDLWVFGGRTSVRSVTGSTERLDLETMRFHEGPPMLGGPRYGCCAARLGADRILIAGGNAAAGQGVALRSTEILDLRTGRFEAGPDLRSPRAHAAAVALDDWRVLICGGQAGEGESLATTEVLYTEDLVLTSGPEMASRRASFGAFKLDAGRVIVIGGSFGFKGMDWSREKKDRGDDDDDNSGDDNPSEALREVAALDEGELNDEAMRWVMAGGPRLTEVLSLETMRFSLGPKMRRQRIGCSIVPLDADRCWVVGGFNDDAQDEGALDRVATSTEIFDRRHFTFSQGPKLPDRRSFLSAAACGPRSVLLLGGVDGFDAMPSTVKLDILTKDERNLQQQQQQLQQPPANKASPRPEKPAEDEEEAIEAEYNRLSRIIEDLDPETHPMTQQPENDDDLFSRPS